MSCKATASRSLSLAAVVAATVVLWAQPAPSSTLGSGLELIERNYLFVSELDAPRLLGSALAYAEQRLPEVRVIDAEHGGHVLVSGPCRLRLEAAPDSSVTALEPVLEKAASLIDDCSSERREPVVDTESLLLTGVLSALDPYSTLFNAERKTEHTIQFQGALAGIGARIGVRDDTLTLVNVYDGAPAARAGLSDGDRVRRIDGVSTLNMPVDDAVGRIRGEVGSIVRLEMQRDGAAEPFTVEVERDVVTIPSVQVRRLDRGILYASISHFSQTTPTDFRARVSEAVAAGDVRGVIVDLRANSGGSMLGSAAIADMFLDEGVLITTSGRNGARVAGLTEEIRAKIDDTAFRDLPVAILTSPRTASGSELLAASLRTHDRAILVGERTFGKGTVQKTYALDRDSSLKMTVGHFLPNGLSIPGGGLAPDVELRSFVFDEHNVRLPEERDTHDLPFWLRTPKWLVSAGGKPRAVLTIAQDAERGEQAVVAAEPAADDAIVSTTARMLARFGSTSASSMLANAQGWLAERQVEAERKLARELDERGVDWRRPSSIQSLASEFSPSLEITVAAENGVLRAGDAADVVVTAKNTGPAPLFRVSGRLSSDAKFLDGHGVLLGLLKPGETRSWTIRVEPPAAVRTSRYPVRVALYGDRGRLFESGPVHLAVDGVARPRLAHRVAVTVADSRLRFDVELRNVGEGAAQDVRASLTHPANDAVELVTASGTVERLEPGESRVVVLEARVLDAGQAPERLDLVVSESKFRAFYETKIDLTPREGFGRWQEAPDIRISSLVPSEDGAYKVIAEAVDDSGLSKVWCRVDGRKVGYIDSHEEPQRRLHLDVPWKPTADVQRVEIVATDSAGMTSSYVTDL